MRRIWAGEPPFEGADPVGPPPVQGAAMPVIAGVMGPKAIARAAHWADGVDGAWTHGRRSRPHDPLVRADPRRVGRRRPHRRAAPLVEHLVRARRRRRGAAHALRVQLHEDHGRRCRGMGGGRGHVLHARRVARRRRPRARSRRRRVLPRAHHVGPRRARAHPRRARDSDTGRRRACSTRSRATSGSTTTATRRSATGSTRLWMSATKEADLNRDRDAARSRPGARQPGEPAAGARLAPHAIPGSRPRTVEAPLILVGMPRSGTTALSHLLAADPDNRSLLGVGGQRVDPAADHHDLPRRPPVRRRARAAPAPST